MKLHHIGIACKRIVEFESWILACGGKRCTPTVYDEHQDATLALFMLEDKTRIEAVSGHPVTLTLKKHMVLHHLCFEVVDMKQSIEMLVSLGCMLVSEPKTAILFNNRNVCFLYAPMGLIELLEESKDEKDRTSTSLDGH